MTILDRILPDVRRELDEARSAVPLGEIKRHAEKARPPRDFAGALTSGGFGLIAEWKQRSPSMGDMRSENVSAAPGAYEASPVVRAISVLTNKTHFGGTMEDLARLAANSTKPILRKDFILDPYQVYAARAAGADAVLLMANVLSAEQMRELHELVLDLGMEALFEVHEAEEIDRLPGTARVVGINSRQFKSHEGFVAAGEGSEQDFTLDFSAFELAQSLPAGCVRVAESGVTPSTVAPLARHFDSALVGTSLLRDSRGVEAVLGDFAAALADTGS
ncbi:MAG: indole-3-glycerol-phosphate synthase [Chthoniobacterales bacterium]|nr:indole-3-glycerol-phosphate synthase [Chthoniobacterales bacterium]